MKQPTTTQQASKAFHHLVAAGDFSTFSIGNLQVEVDHARLHQAVEEVVRAIQAATESGTQPTPCQSLVGFLLTEVLASRVAALQVRDEQEA